MSFPSFKKIDQDVRFLSEFKIFNKPATNSIDQLTLLVHITT
ncbi:hypothetical protein C900_03845 [Fulvivirga imtechensis AK7]|uniref:Uncharacterized protein n=1 Tax=Fulvivirga imtechensis AK7 TaxID=1237149 RepID=L8JMU8_9BACT|nr:hypothetical protein C900_03845 [Fulvivirga imtechensis AK7]